MKHSFSLYPPAGALTMLAVGIGLVSVPVALMVAGGIILVAWVAYFVAHARATARGSA
jgi:hypothetical protein